MRFINLLYKRHRQKKHKVRLLQKAGLREHINLIKSGTRARIYTNQAGEKYSVERKTRTSKDGYTTILENEIGYWIKVLPLTNSSIKTSANLRVHLESKSIAIEGIAIENFNFEKNGRGFMQVVLDECQQIAIKQFGKGIYTVELRPKSIENQLHYSLGHDFKSRKGIFYKDSDTMVATQKV